MLPVFEALAVEAGAAIMEVFHACAGPEVDATHKADASPVTEADRRAEHIILSGLRRAFPDIACVAEEECSAGILPSALDGAFFLVDPLDGTKEFIKRRTDFTVNIALVENGVPVAGVVFAPCTGRLFAGAGALAQAATVDAGGRIAERRPNAARIPSAAVTVVASRSHRTPETDDYIGRFAAAEIVSVGSSLKFCLVAAGEADVYPRFGRTMEWDTAAGDAVLRAAGGMTRTLDGAPLAYGKREQAHDTDFANPFFVASGREHV